MKIFRVVGLVLFIIALKFLMPAVFSGIENALVAFFQTTETILEESSRALPAGSFIPDRIPTAPRR